MFKVTALVSVSDLEHLQDGIYKVRTLTGEDYKKVFTKKSLSGVSHYIEHPHIKQMVESLGAVPASAKFSGLNVEDQVLCFQVDETTEKPVISVRLVSRLENREVVSKDPRVTGEFYFKPPPSD